MNGFIYFAWLLTRWYKWNAVVRKNKAANNTAATRLGV